MTPTDTYFSSDLIYMVIKSKIFFQGNAKEFDCWNFRKDWITNFDAVANVLLGWDYHIWSFSNIERKSVGLEPLINFYQFPIPSGMNIVKADAKTVVSSAKWTKRTWFEDLNMLFIYKRKSTGPNTDPCGTSSAMFDIEELQFSIETYCFLLLK